MDLLKAGVDSGRPSSCPESSYTFALLLPRAQQGKFPLTILLYNGLTHARTCHHRKHARNRPATCK
jgi:hypothetical protein